MKLLTVLLALFLFFIKATGGEMLLNQAYRTDDSRIRSIIQLPDGRMAVATVSGISLFDGSDITNIPLDGAGVKGLPSYDGFHHLYYTDNPPRLWIKTNRELRCLDFTHNKFIEQPENNLADFFVDSDQRIWTIDSSGTTLRNGNIEIAIDNRDSQLQDLISYGDSLCLFFSDGLMECLNVPSGGVFYSGSPYPREDAAKYSRTSLVVKTKDGFLQIRNGSKGALFSFDKATGVWKKLLETDFPLNTLAVAESGEAIVSCPEGLINVDPVSGSVVHQPALRTRTGSLLATEISSIAHDTSGGLWLGTLNRGLFYYHPDIYRHIFIPSKSEFAEPSTFFTENRDGGVIMAGKGETMMIAPDGTSTVEASADNIRPDGEYASGAAFVSSTGSLFFREKDGCHIFMPCTGLDSTVTDKGRHAPVISCITVNGEKQGPAADLIFPHNRNFIGFECASPSFAFPDSTVFRYRLEGLEDEWHTFKASQSPSHRLTASYTSLPPGYYTFAVSTQGTPESRIAFRIRPPWWQTTAAYLSFTAFLLFLIATGIRLYISYMRRKMERRLREERLLERIRDLISQCRSYQQESERPAETVNANDSADADFIARAVEMVERNINTPGYSVEQLSRDLCMERTGLYRKLTSMLDRSPSLFIRDIRLKCAARLLAEGQMSVAEVAEATGFSSSSYMSKCFVETYGCRPSEYADKNTKST